MIFDILSAKALYVAIWLAALSYSVISAAVKVPAGSAYVAGSEAKSSAFKSSDAVLLS